MIAADPLPSLALDPDEIPQALQDVILRCLQKDPDRRYQNVAELATELMPFGGSQSSASVGRIGRLLQSASAARRAKAQLRRGFLAASWTAAAALLALLGQRLYATSSWGSSEPAQTLVRPPESKPEVASGVTVENGPSVPERVRADAGAVMPSSIEIAPNPLVVQGQHKTSPKGTSTAHPSHSADPRGSHVEGVAPSPDGLQDRK